MKSHIALNFLAVLLATPTALAEERTPVPQIFSIHCGGECPVSENNENDIVFYPSHTLSANPETLFADWVAYFVDISTIGRSAGRNWHPDRYLDDSETLEPDDFERLSDEGYDRGHQAPLASLINSSQWWTLNYMSNITPQRSELNRGPWQRLETAVRTLVEDAFFSRVYVFTGPLYETPEPPLPNADEPHTVPSGYWKVIFVLDGSEVSTLVAFIFDQETSRSADFCNFQVTIAEVTEWSDIHFARLTELANNASDRLEEERILTALGCTE